MKKRTKIYIDISEMPEGEDKKKTYQKKYHVEYSRKKKQLHIRLDDEEYTEIKERSEREGMPMSRYVMTHYRASTKGSIAREGTGKQLVKELVRIGTNLNQIARWANSMPTCETLKMGVYGGNETETKTIIAFQERLEQIREELQEIKTKYFGNANFHHAKD